MLQTTQIISDVCFIMTDHVSYASLNIRKSFESRRNVWPCGKAQAGKQRDLGSNPLRLSFLFKSCGLWTLSCDFAPHNYETLKWLSSLPTLMQKSFFPLPPLPYPLPPFSPSLISLMVSVDVKQHVYLLSRQNSSFFFSLFTRGGCASN